MNRSLIVGLFAVIGVTSTANVALATKTVIQTKGMDVGGSFDVQKTRTCAGGGTGSDSTSVQIDMVEATTTINRAPATVRQTSISVFRFDGCNFETSFGYGLFTGVGTLTMNALQTGTITGHFVLDDGTTLDVNLTMTGSDTTSLGANSRRTILGKTMTLQRSIGSSRTATVSGTVKIDGQTITAAQMTNANGQLSRNTGGDITIIKP
jgi:hypothetical protein